MREEHFKGNKDEEKRLKEKYKEALGDIMQKYPRTKAADKAKELLDE